MALLIVIQRPIGFDIMYLQCPTINHLKCRKT